MRIPFTRFLDSYYTLYTSNHKTLSILWPLGYILRRRTRTHGRRSCASSVCRYHTQKQSVFKEGLKRELPANSPPFQPRFPCWRSLHYSKPAYGVSSGFVRYQPQPAHNLLIRFLLEQFESSLMQLLRKIKSKTENTSTGCTNPMD